MKKTTEHVITFKKNRDRKFIIKKLKIQVTNENTRLLKISLVRKHVVYFAQPM